MKISKDRFEEILSTYLDGEASPDELELLAKCVRGDSRMSSIYYRACRVHAATRAMYGKKTTFVKLDGVPLPIFERKTPSKMRAIMEWAAVAVLMLTSVSLMWIAYENASLPTSSEHQNLQVSRKLPVTSKASIADSTEISSTIVVEGNVFSVIRVRFSAPLIVQE